MDKLRQALSGNEPRDDDSESGILPGFPDTSLSYSTRIKAFIFCFAIGIFISFLASLSLFLGKGMPHFAIFYTLGNIVSMLSTCFLMGPVNQLKKMFSETRIIATILVFVTIGLTIFASIIDKHSLVFIFIICQWLAMTWYSLSYIPYARNVVKQTVNSCIA